MSNYQLEYSKSSRAQCQTCNAKIFKSCLRVGKMIHLSNIGEMGRTAPVWIHWTCFWSPDYTPGYGEKSRAWSNFDGVEKLSLEDQKIVHLQIKGVPMEEDQVKKVQNRKDSDEAQAVFSDSDPETIIYTMINKHLDVMKVVDIKEVIRTSHIDGGKKTKKADLIKVVMNQSVDKIANLAYDSLHKNLTASSLKDILQGQGQSCTGNKKDLIKRLLQSSGGVSHPQNIVVAEKPVPGLSTKEMGPDVDLVHEEWPHLQPYVTIGSPDDVKIFIDNKTKPRQLKIACNFSIGIKDFIDIISSCGLDLIVLEAGDSDTGCRLDRQAAAYIADHCPRLQKLGLESCSFTDDDLVRIGYCCPRLRYLKVSGNNKSSGNLKDKFLKTFKEDRSFLKKLKILDLTDQGCDFTQVERMSKSRKSVLVRNGNSGDDRWYMPDFGGDSCEMMGGKFHY